MLPHCLTNFEMQRYQNKHRFNGVYSRNDLLIKMKGGVNVYGLDMMILEITGWLFLLKIIK